MQLAIDLRTGDLGIVTPYRINIGPTLPSTSIDGTLFIDSTDNGLYVYYAGGWHLILILVPVGTEAALLQEDEFDLLLEDGFKFLLETAAIPTVSDLLLETGDHFLFEDGFKLVME